MLAFSKVVLDAEFYAESNDSTFDYFEILQVCRFPLIADNGPPFSSNEMKDIFMTNRVSSLLQQHFNIHLATGWPNVLFDLSKKQ